MTELPHIASLAVGVAAGWYLSARFSGIERTCRRIERDSNAQAIELNGRVFAIENRLAKHGSDGK